MGIRWGLIGSGRIIPRFLNGMEQVEEAIPAAIYSRNKGKAQDLAHKYNIEQVFDDFDEFIEKSNIDVAYIAMPHHLHQEYAEKCLNAKIPVFCEKPMGPNVIQESKMIECAKANDTFLAEAMWSRFFPVYQQLFKWIQDGKIGKVIAMNGIISFKPIEKKEDRLFDPDQAGGSLLDLGIYLVSLADFVFNRPPQDIKVLASINKYGTDDNDGMLFKYDQGEIASFISSFRTEAKDFATIYGTNGMIEIGENFWKPRSMRMTCESGAIDFNCSAIDNDSVYNEHYPSFNGEGYQFEIEHVHDCLKKGLKESPIIPHKKSLEIMSVCDRMRKELGIVYPFEK